MRTLVSLLTLLLLLSLALVSQAELTTLPSPESTLPANALNFPDILSGRVQLSWEEFKAVLDQIKTPEKPIEKDPPPVDWSLNSVEYNAEAAELRRVRVEVRMDITVLNNDTWVSIPVLHESVAPISIKLDGETTALARVDDGWHALMLKGAGTHTLESTFFVSQTKSEGKSSFLFPTPRTPMTTMALRIPMADARVSSPAAARIYATRGSDFLNVDLAFKGTDDIQVEWVSPTLVSQQPQPVEALTAGSIATLAQVSETHIGLISTLNYTILRGEVDRFRIALPTDANVFDVNGPKGLEWQRREQDGTQIIEVMLNHKVNGELSFNMEYEVKLVPGAQSFTIPQLEVLDVLRSSGYIAVAANTNLELKPGDEMASLSRVDVVELPDTLSNLAKKPIALGFRYNNGEYTLPLDMVVSDPRVASNTGTLATISDTHIALTSQIRFDVLRGAVQKFRIALPENVNVSSIDGKGILPSVETVDGRQIHTISLDREVFDTYQFSVRYEIPLPDDMALLQIPELEVLDTVRSRGDIAVTVAGNMEINEEGEIENARRIDEVELPPFVRGQSHTPILFAYHYNSNGYTLGFNAKKLQDVAVQVAVIDEAHITTLITNQKQITTLAKYAVRNNERQFLRIALGDSAEILGARVAGRPAKPSIDAKTKEVLLPLRKTGPDGAPFLVELVYTEEFPESKNDRAKFSLIAPATDMKIDEVYWDLRVPESNHLYDFRTELEHIKHTVQGREISFGATLSSVQKNMSQLMMRDDSSDDYEGLRQTESNTFIELDSLGYVNALRAEDRAFGAARVAGVMPLRVKMPNKGAVYTFNRLYVPMQTPLALHVNIGMKSTWKKQAVALAILGAVLGFVCVRVLRASRNNRRWAAAAGVTATLLGFANVWHVLPYFGAGIAVGVLPFVVPALYQYVRNGRQRNAAALETSVQS
jgi:hypothetical protein